MTASARKYMSMRRRAEPDIRPIRRPDHIIEYWKREKLVVTFIVIFGLGFNGASILGPIWQGRMIDSLLNSDPFERLLGVTATFLLLVLAIQTMRYFKRFYIRRFANKTSAVMRFMIYNNIMHKSFAQLEKESAGDLMTKALSDVDLCVEGMRKFTTELFDTGVLMLSYLVAMLVYDIRITVVSCLFIPAAMILAEKLKTVIFKYSKAYRSKSSEISELTLSSVENAMLYRANGMEAKNAARYGAELLDYQEKAIRADILENSMQPVYNVIAMTGVILVLYLGGGKVMGGGWTVGEFSAFLTMFTALAVKASKAAKLFNSVQKSEVSWRRIRPYMSEFQSKEPFPGEGEPSATGEQAAPDSGEGMLAAQGLTFCYPSGEEYVLKNISFRANPGDIIGITGPVASGKSTLGLSLLGLYPYEGNIRIGGRELRDYSEAERSGMIAYLGHKPQLLSDTIYNNITLGGGQDISQVLRDVCFEEDLKSMPEGTDTPVGNRGIRLSGGQQSRIALARTLLEKKKIIILDDPFASVDMKTEEAIIGNLRENYRKCLILLISHRLAVFPKVSQVLFLRADGTAEAGTHEELMRTSERYAAIYSLQSSMGEDLDEE